MKREIPKTVGQKSGVYKITNTINNKYYIGSTKNFSSRYRTHKYALNKGTNGCRILQQAVTKYGIENFIFSIVKVCENYKKEESKILNDNFPPYNMVLEAGEKRKLAASTRKKMSDNMKKRFKERPEIWYGKRKSYIKYNPVYNHVVIKKDDFIKEFDGVNQCAEYLKVTPAAIYLAFNRPTKCKGHSIIISSIK